MRVGEGGGGRERGVSVCPRRHVERPTPDPPARVFLPSLPPLPLSPPSHAPIVAQHLLRRVPRHVEEALGRVDEGAVGESGVGHDKRVAQAGQHFGQGGGGLRDLEEGRRVGCACWRRRAWGGTRWAAGGGGATGREWGGGGGEHFSSTLHTFWPGCVSSGWSGGSARVPWAVPWAGGAPIVMVVRAQAGREGERPPLYKAESVAPNSSALSLSPTNHHQGFIRTRALRVSVVCILSHQPLAFLSSLPLS